MPNPKAIQKVSNKHEAIIQHLIANPLDRLQDVAAKFEVTQPWLSQIIHSDAFKARLRDRQDEMFSPVVATMKERIERTAAMALDKIAEQIPTETDTRALVDVADRTLKALGYGTKPQGPANHGPVVNQQNNYYVQPELLERAQKSIGVIHVEEDQDSSRLGAPDTLAPLQADDPAWAVEEAGSSIREESTSPNAE